MNVKIYIDRYVESKYVDEAEKKSGTQFEENATTIKFDFSELDFLDDECVKTIHFFHDSLEEANYVGDSIIQNDEFKIPKSVTEYENVVAFVQITKEDFVWKTKSFDLHFNQSLDVDKTLDEDKTGILQELIVEVQQIKIDTSDEYKKLAEEETKKFNDNATTKFKEYNENHTTKLNAYNENAADKIAEYDEHIEDLDNVVSKNIVSGESVSVDDALEYKIFGTKIDGNAEQVTTTGKNLLKYQPTYIPGYSKTENGVTFTVNDDYSITINGTNNGSNSSINIANGLILQPGTYISNLNGTGWKITMYNGSQYIDYNVARTLETETTFSQVYIEPTSLNKTYDNLTLYPMLVAGSESPGNSEDVYEPYTGGASPNPDYPQEISVVSDEVKMVQTGKNLFNNVNYGHLGFWVQSAGQNTTMAESESYLSAYCKVRPGETYTISREVISNRFAIAACDEVPNVNTTALVLAVDSDAKSLTVTVPDNYNYLVLYLQNDGAYTDVGLQIEEGSVATDYEEYKSNEYDIDLQDNELVKLTDDIKDTVDIDKSGNVSLNKRIGKVILNGTESWFLSNVGSYQVFGLTKSDVAKNILISDRFTYYKQVNNIKDREGISNDNTKQRIYISNGTSSTVEDFKAWLADHNVTVYYELAEPTTSSLGQLTNFKTFASVNHFFLEANLATNFEIRYAQDLQKVISKQQEEIDELKTLLSSTATSALLLDNYANDLMEEV